LVHRSTKTPLDVSLAWLPFERRALERAEPVVLERIKPLREVGAIEPVTFDPRQRAFVAGHPIAKSSNSAYRLADDFRALLQAEEKVLASMLEAWIAEDAVRRRLALQSILAEKARTAMDTTHADLIAAACEFYVPRFVPGFDVLYIDAGGGDRIPEAARSKLAKVGLELRLEDAMPDVLLANRTGTAFWVVEAVTNDGEVDLHKVAQATRFIKRAHPDATVGFTTVYRSWREAAGRQSQHKNLAPGTFLWILEDPSKQFHVEAFE
ncbi:MAG: BsuBI/PstI family type II restriction endonuclease, partial [Candidatus Binatia bacterium]